MSIAAQQCGIIWEGRKLLLVPRGLQIVVGRAFGPGRERHHKSVAARPYATKVARFAEGGGRGRMPAAPVSGAGDSDFCGKHCAHHRPNRGPGGPHVRTFQNFFCFSFFYVAGPQMSAQHDSGAVDLGAATGLHARLRAAMRNLPEESAGELLQELDQLFDGEMVALAQV